MSRVVCAVMCCMLAGTGVASPPEDGGQPTVSVGSRIWDLERAYHDHIQTGDFESVAGFWHEAGVAWPSYADEPLDLVAGRAALSELLDPLRILSVEIHPLSIRVVGDVAVVHYRLDWEIASADGSKSTASSRITHTWIKHLERWRIIGGMSSSIPAG